MRYRLKAALIMIAAAFAFTSPALAQLSSDVASYNQAPAVIGASPIGSPTLVHVSKPTGGVIDLGQVFSESLQPWVNEFVNALILAGITWLGNWLRTKYKVDIDEKHRDALTTFLQNQAGSLIADGAVKLNGTKINVDNVMLAQAANRALHGIPDAMKHFGLTPDVVADKIVDAIPQIAAGAQMIAQAHVKDSGTEALP